MAGAGLKGRPAEAPEGLADSTTGGMGTLGRGMPIDVPGGTVTRALGAVEMLGITTDVALASLSKPWGLCNQSVGGIATGTGVLASKGGGGGRQQWALQGAFQV